MLARVDCRSISAGPRSDKIRSAAIHRRGLGVFGAIRRRGSKAPASGSAKMNYRFLHPRLWRIVDAGVCHAMNDSLCSSKTEPILTAVEHALFRACGANRKIIARRCPLQADGPLNIRTAD